MSDHVDIIDESMNVIIRDDMIEVVTIGTTGPNGPQGPQGVQGTQGVKGDTGSGSNVTIQDEGAGLGLGSTLNFTGPGVVASGSGSVKTITVPGGVILPRMKRNMALHPDAGASTVSAVGMPAPTLSGTLTGISWNQDQRGPMLRHITGSAINDRAGVLPPSMNVVRAGWRPRLSGVVWPNQLETTQRVWFGLFASDPALNTLPTFDHAGFLYNPSVVSTWQCSSGDGSAANQQDSGVLQNTAFPKRLELEVDTVAGTIQFWIDGVLVATKTTNLPRTTVDLGYAIQLTTTSAEARQFYWGRMNLEHTP